MSSQAERRATTIAAILASARALFAARGFELTSIDDIAERADVAKGAVYHHFDSKEAVFTAVLEGVQAEIFNSLSSLHEQREGDLVDLVVNGVEHYLRSASAPGIGQILLIDGPVVIGWRRWREIDDQHFGATARASIAALLGPGASPTQVDVLTHLLMGAVMEAAMVCATATDAHRSAGELAGGLRRMLKGLTSKP
jgi:AcrR family transcriptional regulator